MADVKAAAVRAASPISTDERDRLFEPLEGLPLALCVSGGADSIALLHLVAEWAADPRKAGERRPPARPDDNTAAPPIVVVSVDHGLRREARTETAFVAAQAARFGLPCWRLAKRDDCENPPPETGIQEWARALRHRLILEAIENERRLLADCSAGLRGKQGGGWRRVLVMAHHLNDQAETVLMRLGRGSGVDGLTGMRARQKIRAEVSARQDGGGTHAGAKALEVLSGEVVRPFLGIGKDRLLASLKARGAAWIEDPSNREDRFERVRVRKALAALSEVGISAESIALSARRLGDAQALLAAVNHQLVIRSVAWNDGLFGEVAFSGLMVGTREGMVSRHALVRLLETVLKAYGGQARPAGLAQIEELADQLAAAVLPAKRFSGRTLGGCRVEPSGGSDASFRIFRETGREGLPELELAPGASLAWDAGRFIVTASREAPWPVAVGALGAEGWAQLKSAMPALSKLGLPAAPMATMPAFRRNDEIVDVPFISAVLAGNAGSSGSEWLEARHSWTSAMPSAGGCFSAGFGRFLAE